ncbi:MAG: hypothetical protein V2I65_04775 [Paracoccaceae bacterium]|nr:hypothetical protein [Paracoccaceae bacterium]
MSGDDGDDDAERTARREEQRLKNAATRERWRKRDADDRRWREATLTHLVALLDEVSGNARLAVLAQIAEAAFYERGARGDREIGKEIADAIRSLKKANIETALENAYRNREIARLYVLNRAMGQKSTEIYREIGAIYGLDWTRVRDVIVRETPLSKYIAWFPELDEAQLLAILPPLKPR